MLVRDQTERGKSQSYPTDCQRYPAEYHPPNAQIPLGCRFARDEGEKSIVAMQVVKLFDVQNSRIVEIAGFVVLSAVSNLDR